MIRTGLVALAFVVSGPALAADLLVEVSEETPAAVYDWTGFYAGVQGGGAAAASLFSQRDAAGAVVGPLQQTFNDWAGSSVSMPDTFIRRAILSSVSKVM